MLSRRLTALEERLAENDENFSFTLERLVEEFVGRIQRVEALQVGSCLPWLLFCFVLL